jgi:uncharacterized membrane protein
MRQILIVSIIMALLDLPWLGLIGTPYMNTVRMIQGGREARTRPLAGAIVYLAMAYLVLQTTSLFGAFLTGMAVYAVYDFTVFALFKDYPIHLAIVDSIWGGVLFMATFWILRRFGLQHKS